MADLFSFGNEGGAPPISSPGQEAAAAAAAPVITEAAAPEEKAPPERVLSSDSILDMLDGETGAETSVLGEASSPAVPMQDQDAQDILNWLDEEETLVESESDVVVKEESKAGEPKDKEVKQEEETKEVPAVLPATKDEKAPAVPVKTEDTPATAAPEPAPTIAVIPPLPTPPPIHFDSLEDALDSPKSTIGHLRALFVDGGMKVDPARRAELWCRTVCGKTLEDVESSSLAEGFLDWKKMANIEEGEDARK